MKYLEMVAKAQLVLDSLTGDKKKGDQIWELVKSGEMKGLTQKPEEFESLMVGMIKAAVSNPKIMPSDFFSAFKYGRSAMYGWDEEFITQFLPTLIGEMKSGSGGGGGGGGTGGPGNALMSMYQAIVSGQMPKSSADEFLALGLLKDKDYQPMEGTAVGKVSAEGVTGTKEFMRNPYKWVQDVLMPALEAKYGHDQEKIIAEVSRLFRTRTAGAVAILQAVQGSEFAGDASRMEKDARLQRLAMPGGLNATVSELLAHDPTIVMEAFHKQWSSMLEALGSPLVYPAMDAINRITGVFTSIARLAGEHPEGVKIFFEAVIALAVTLGGLGLAALAALLAPLVGTGGLIFALVTALTALAAVNWGSISAGFNSIRASLSGLIDSMNQKFPALKKLDEFFGLDHPQQSPKNRIDDGFGALKQPMMFTPGSNQPKPQPISLSLNVDGRTLAQVMSEQLESLYGFPTTAPSSNGWQGFRSPDDNKYAT